MNSWKKIVSWKFPLFIGLILSLLYLHFLENKAYVELDVTVSQKTHFDMFWAKEGEGYSKWRRKVVWVYPGKTHYAFGLTDLRAIQKLRIDPLPTKGEVSINKLVISQKGFQPLRFVSREDFSLFKPLLHIDLAQPTANGLEIRSVGNDPQLEIQISLEKGPSRFPQVLIRIMSIFFLVFLFFKSTATFRDADHFIPLFFTAAYILIVVMAAISAANVHPDEYVHRNAAEYYMDNWLPPEVDDPAIQHTYSIYGVSRLNNHEVSYFFTGKLTELLSGFRLTDAFKFRIFNTLLFGVLLLYVLKSHGARLMAVPLLISPQIWYIFSYSNSDAFSLFIAFLIACQLALPDSALNAYLLGRQNRNNSFRVVLFSALFAALFLLKMNYWFYITFILGYILWVASFSIPKGEKKNYLQRFFIVFLLGLAVAGTRIGVDYAVNGMDRSARIAQIQEKLAKPIFKPSTPLEKQHSFLYRKARGDSLKKIIVVDRWFEKSYCSAFGMYGYFTVVATDSYYNAVRWVGVAFFTFFMLGIFWQRGIDVKLLFLFFLGCFGALTGASLYHSWTMDFQTQGRYLFPVIPMLSIVLYHSRYLMQVPLFKVFLSAMFVLSVYSFIFVGLLQIPKMM